MNPHFIDPTLPQNHARVIEYISAAIGRDVSALSECPRLATGGAENRNYFVSAIVEGTQREYVLRCPPKQIPEWRQSWGLYDLEREFRVLQELPALNIGLPTPGVFGFSDVFGVSCFLMECLPGERLNYQYQPSYEAIVRTYADAVATVSNIAFESSPWLKANLPMRTIDNELQWFEEQSLRFQSEPLRDYSLSWLRERRPQSRPLRMSQGDPNPSNFLMEDGRITGVVDWEFACLVDDSLGCLLRVGWLHESEELRKLFCRAMQRDVAELQWHFVHSLFLAVFVLCNEHRSQHAERLAEFVGFSNGL